MSIINHDHQHCFIHVPKTAGRAMEQQHWVGGNGHAPLAKLKPDIPEGFITWAFVRNPYARLLSAYSCLTQRPQEPVEDVKAHPSFYRWVRWLWQNPARLNKHAHTKPQVNFVCVEGAIAVDFLGRFERLQGDWARLFVKLFPTATQIDPLPLVNESEHAPWQEVFEDRRLRAMVMDLYRADFDTLEYSTTD